MIFLTFVRFFFQFSWQSRVAISDGDVPLALFSLSFLVYEGYNVVSKVGVERFHALASFLLGLGIALFAGSIVMAFF